jgi:hypothetical protein
LGYGQVLTHPLQAVRNHFAMNYCPAVPWGKGLFL